MKILSKLNYLVLVFTIFVITNSCNKNKIKVSEPTFQTFEDSLNYLYGFYTGKSFKEGEGYTKMEEINIENFIAGINDAFDNNERIADRNVVNAIFERKRNQINESKAEKTKLEGMKNIEEGNAFLEKNSKEEGVITTPSGLQYKVITMGNGKKPAETSRVKVHYVGSTINGKVFDSSIERGQPAEFGLNQVIKGWTEGLQLMPSGSKFKFFIPSNLGYGEKSQGEAIPPNSVLIFEVELLEVL